MAALNQFGANKNTTVSVQVERLKSAWSKLALVSSNSNIEDPLSKIRDKIGQSVQQTIKTTQAAKQAAGAREVQRKQSLEKAKQLSNLHERRA